MELYRAKQSHGCDRQTDTQTLRQHATSVAVGRMRELIALRVCGDA